MLALHSAIAGWWSACSDCLSLRSDQEGAVAVSHSRWLGPHHAHPVPRGDGLLLPKRVLLQTPAPLPVDPGNVPGTAFAEIPSRDTMATRPLCSAVNPSCTLSMSQAFGMTSITALYVPRSSSLCNFIASL